MDETKKDRILTAALSVFLRYGYRRVNMNDIAAAAGMSRPALYVLFKNKEEIFAGVILRWADEAVAEIAAAGAKATTPEERIRSAFEIWSVRPFQMMLNSPEAKEVMDCSFEFAQAALQQSYRKFEGALAPILSELAGKRGTEKRMSPEGAAQVLAHAVRGFKYAAATAAEMRSLIHKLLLLSFGVDIPGKAALRELRSTQSRKA